MGSDPLPEDHAGGGQGQDAQLLQLRQEVLLCSGGSGAQSAGPPPPRFHSDRTPKLSLSLSLSLSALRELWETLLSADSGDSVVLTHGKKANSQRGTDPGKCNAKPDFSIKRAELLCFLKEQE